MLRSTIETASERGLIESKPQAAIDGTGLETRHVSRHFESRRGNSGPFIHHAWPKLTIVQLTRTHLIAAAAVGQGPSQDSSDFPEPVRQASSNLKLDQLLGDCGYDGEHNHRLAREDLGIRSTVIKLNPRRGLNTLPKGRYRAQMFRKFLKHIYGQGWQAESGISRNKRLLGPALRAKKPASQQNECQLRVLTHNLMILRAAS